MDVVFLHGSLMGPDLWEAQVAGLDDVADTHSLAAPAHGTEAPPDGFDMAAWAKLVMDELDRRSVERAIFVGHSMSGWLTQQIWRDHPQRVLGIGLVAATERPATARAQEQFRRNGERAVRDWAAFAPRIAQVLVGSHFRSSDPGWLDRWTEHVGREYDIFGMIRLIAAINGRPDYTSTTSRISIPATVVHGTDDDMFPLEFGRRLAALIPEASLVEVEGSGHAPPMDQPAPVTQAIRDLVGRVTE